MALHETSEKRTYLNVSCGRFWRWMGKDKEKVPYEAVDGFLERLSVVQDPGDTTRKIKPFAKLVMELRDGETGDLYEVAGRFESTFGWMLASHLSDIEKGERIKLNTWPGSEVDKVSCVLVSKAVEGNWVRAARKDYPRDDDSEKFSAAYADVESHPAYVVPETWKNGVSDKIAAVVEQIEGDGPPPPQDEYEPFPPDEEEAGLKGATV